MDAQIKAAISHESFNREFNCIPVASEDAKEVDADKKLSNSEIYRSIYDE